MCVVCLEACVLLLPSPENSLVFCAGSHPACRLLFMSVCCEFREALIVRYGLDRNASWADPEEFLGLLAVRLGKLKKGAEPDISTAARISECHNSHFTTHFTIYN